jgi:prophage tail gpP-like protein
MNFHDSQLEPPYEINEPSSQDIAKFATDPTATPFIFGDQAAPTTTVEAPKPVGLADAISARETVNQGETGFQFCARTISKKRNMVMGCTPQGWLTFRQPDLQSPVVGTIEEGRDFTLTEYQADFDIRKRYRTVKAITDTKRGQKTATAGPAPINFNRHKIVTVSNQIEGGVQANADWELNLLAIAALSKDFNLTGWKIGGQLLKVNTRITVVSKTMGFPDGFTFFINAVEYSKTDTSKTAKISVIPPNAYTNQTVVEPWF